MLGKKSLVKYFSTCGFVTFTTMLDKVAKYLFERWLRVVSVTMIRMLLYAGALGAGYYQDIVIIKSDIF
jgi:hypothetical protein